MRESERQRERDTHRDRDVGREKHRQKGRKMVWMHAIKSILGRSKSKDQSSN